MHKQFFRALALILLAAALLISPGLPASGSQTSASQPAALQTNDANSLSAAATPVFRFPVVPGATISGYFDHQSASGIVMFYDGRHNSPGAGFYFSCSNPAMYDWVGCEDAVAGEPACQNSRELWYDNHHGIDFEYSPAWHTGATCDPGRFAGITMPVYAPARGKVIMAGYDPNRPANGWHIRIAHDLNGNGNFDDDNFRSVYLHFTANALAVSPGQIVEEGQYLGLGGSTGYSSSPHLHFEVQRSSDRFQTTYWPVDPFGWQGPGSDPYAYANVNLWQTQPALDHVSFLPQVSNLTPICTGCGELLLNTGFEEGHSTWVEPEPSVILRPQDAGLPVLPHTGDWLARLGGRNDAVDPIYQDFTVPMYAAYGHLNYYLYISSDETGDAKDYLYVRLRLPDGTVLQEMEFLNNTFTPRNQWVQRVIDIPDLGNWQGQTLRVNFKGTNDSSNPTSFYIDDVSLIAFGQ